MQYNSNKSQTYTYAPLPGKYGHYGIFRIAGPGLGNLLYPWARSIVIAKKYGFTPIWPTWGQINTAKNPVMLIERLKRHYFDLFRVTDDYVHSYSKLKLLLLKTRIDEDHFINLAPDADVQDKIIMFQGMKSLFAEILHDHDLIYSELKKITRQKHFAKSDAISGDAIGVHIRLGDLRTPKTVDILEGGQLGYRLPIRWFVANIDRLNEIFDYRYKIQIFSDGSDSQLKEVLAIKNAERVEIKSALGALHAMSKMKMFVASGSTMSMWASYLGRMPVIWFKGQCRQRLYYANPDGELEIGLDEDFPDSFMNILKTI